MKQIFVAIFALFIMVGCENNECECEKDEYYVKYKIIGNTHYSGLELDVTISTEKNENETYIVDAQGKWEITIGPVQKGFNASLQIIPPEENNLTLDVSIWVSKNDSPFAIKAMADGFDTSGPLQIDYTIDF